jgi:hypothetical protein
METLNTSRVDDLRAWLETLPHPCHDVKPVRVTIGRQTWEGCEYKQESTPPEGAPNQAPYTIHALYLLGTLRRSYLHSSHECYPWEGDGREWYTAGYWQHEGTSESQPFGRMFLLHPWEVPTGESIDKYERHPYRRLPMSVEYLTSA